MSSKTNAYWAKREEEALRRRITDEKEYDKRIKEIYADMLDACQKEIDSFYGKYASAEGISINEAKKRVSQLDIEAYERKAARYVKDKTFSNTANAEMRLYNATMKINRLEMLKANIGIELISGHDELEKFMEKILQGRTEDELKRQAGILGDTIRDNAKAAHSIVNASFHNATFSERIWMYQDLLKADLAKLLQSGMIQGKNPRVLARELESKFGASRSDAERLMRTELARVQTEAQRQSFENMGFDEYTFHANSNCCGICQDLNGKHFKIKDMMPGENAAPLHPGCRCSCSAYEDSDEYEAWLDFLANGGTTEEWKQKNAGKSVANKSGYGIIEMTRKINDNRDGFKFISDKIFNDLTIPARKKGAVIVRGTDEAEEHLRKINAAASNVGDILIFRKNVCISEVLEETYHFEQNLRKVNNDKPEPLRSILNEIDAKQFLLDNADKYKIPRNEVELTKEQLKSYQKRLEEYKRGGGGL